MGYPLSFLWEGVYSNKQKPRIISNVLIEGKPQCTGEAEYTDDIPPIFGELHAAVVQAQQANCELDVVDASAALVSEQD